MTREEVKERANEIAFVYRTSGVDVCKKLIVYGVTSRSSIKYIADLTIEAQEKGKDMPMSLDLLLASWSTLSK